MAPSKEMKEAIDEAKTQILMTLSQTQNSIDGSMERFRRSVGSSTLPGLTGTPTETLHGAILNLWQELTDAQTSFREVRIATNKNLAIILRKVCALNQSNIQELIKKEVAKVTEQTHAKPPPKWMHPMKKNMKRTSIREHGGCTSTAKVKKETQADDFGSSLDVINLVSDNEETVDSTQVDGGTEVIEERLIPVAETIEIISAAEAAAEQNDAAEGGEEVATEERVAQNEDPQ